MISSAPSHSFIVCNLGCACVGSPEAAGAAPSGPPESSQPPHTVAANTNAKSDAASRRRQD